MIRKNVVFDLDETLGYFVQINNLWQVLVQYSYKTGVDVIRTQTYFNYLLDLYPEFIRNNIYPILKYIKIKKKNNDCQKVLIYTNNKCNIEWVNTIKRYLEYKINFDIFDDIIGAYKINNIIINPSRTSTDKTYEDLLNCSNINSNEKICMIDNSTFSIKNNDKVHYIKVNSYIHKIPFDIIISRFQDSVLFKNSIFNEQHFGSFIEMNKYRFNTNVGIKPNITKIIDNVNTKRMMFQLQIFFTTEGKTRRNKHKCCYSRKNKHILL